MAAIEAHDLVKTYGSTTALDGASFEVPEATVLGLLGPNGAGKTTAVKVLTTLTRPDSGAAQVAGVDVLADPDVLRTRIGLAGQYSAVDERLTGRENLEMFGRLTHMPRSDVRRRATQLLERFDLADAGDRVTRGYSGGMRRRLDLASALVNTPPVLFLDEPTTGLDPRSRIQLWGVISELVDDGTTLLLTTQYLEEADRLADRIAVIDSGRVIADGTADELKDAAGGSVLEVRVAGRGRAGEVAALLADLTSGEPEVDEVTEEVSVPVESDALTLLRHASERLDDSDLDVTAIGIRRPTLDDVFLTLTGQALEPAAGDDDTDDR